MNRLMRTTVFIAAAILGLAAGRSPGAETADELLKRASQAVDANKKEEAIKLATSAVDLEPKNGRVRLTRGAVYEYFRAHKEAIDDFTTAVALDPTLVQAYDHRGSEKFKLGDVDGSIEDFDRYLKARPADAQNHWKRGLSYYYAGRFEAGKKQFEDCRGVEPDDVENAVWRYLCMSRLEGAEKARAGLYKVTNDPRVPMMQVLAMFEGKLKPEDVLNSARAGKPTDAELNERLFYAHLYIGLYFEAAGDGARALENLTEAEKHGIGHYMWDVAHVHVGRLKKAPK